MTRFFTQRLLSALFVLAAFSFVVFFLIQLPPGDFADAWAANKAADGERVTPQDLENFREVYGLNDPFIVQYLRWIGNVLTGELGFSYEYQKPVAHVLAERLPLTLGMAFAALTVIYLVGVPLGLYSAVRKRTLADYTATFFGYLGLATPNFLLALILVFFGYKWFGLSAGGVFSPEYLGQSWSWGKFWDFMAHLVIPVLVLGTAGTAAQVRTMRATMLDELSKPYVMAARASGLSFWKAIWRYPARVAIVPIAATLGWEITTVISGAPIVGVVLSLPEMGPVFLQSLISQDMPLAGAILLIYYVLVVIGTLISDILLFWLDPRIRMEVVG
ncbi:MAG: ABC transporter permease [Pelagimonas sp.]|nr:ABC transporter permease [Pelagimonas sp.]